MEEMSYFLGILDKVEIALWNDPNLSKEEVLKIVNVLHQIDDIEQKRITKEIRG